MKNRRFRKVSFLVLSLFGVMGLNSVSAERVFWESADKCVYGCYQPGGDCLSADPWEQTDC